MSESKDTTNYDLLFYNIGKTSDYKALLDYPHRGNDGNVRCYRQLLYNGLCEGKADPAMIELVCTVASTSEEELFRTAVGTNRNDIITYIINKNKQNVGSKHAFDMLVHACINNVDINIISGLIPDIPKYSSNVLEYACINNNDKLITQIIQSLSIDDIRYITYYDYNVWVFVDALSKYTGKILATHIKIYIDKLQVLHHEVLFNKQSRYMIKYIARLLYYNKDVLTLVYKYDIDTGLPAMRYACKYADIDMAKFALDIGNFGILHTVCNLCQSGDVKFVQSVVEYEPEYFNVNSYQEAVNYCLMSYPIYYNIIKYLVEESNARLYELKLQSMYDLQDFMDDTGLNIKYFIHDFPILCNQLSIYKTGVKKRLRQSLRSILIDDLRTIILNYVHW